MSKKMARGKMTVNSEWISVNDHMPDVHSDKFRILLANGTEMDAYFYKDSIAWISYYGQKTSHWWNCNGSKERLDTVTHWMPLQKPPA